MIAVCTIGGHGALNASTTETFGVGGILYWAVRRLSKSLQLCVPKTL